MNSTLVAAIATAVALVLIALGWSQLRILLRRQTIYEWQFGLVYRRGRFVAQVGPGSYWVSPFTTIQVLTAAEQMLVVSGQEVLSSDGFPVKLGAVCRFRISDPRLVQEKYEHGPLEVLQVAVQLGLRSIAVTRSIDAIIAARNELDGELLTAVKADAAALGLEIVELRLRDLILPAEVRRMMTEVERARREGLAALERARGEQAALRALANAARLLKNNPELQNLRILQALAGTNSKNAPTLVLGTGNSLILPQRAGDGEAAKLDDAETPAPDA